ncbi:ArdC family protein [Mucilaginibacter jinjuensis]|uniref:Zincin-like metallopeptidase domain-containing protein n=1 Tax=Mucilaginibacter jinjuensis TaxID=1176721 RepID=A0ABY7TB55_9SPHI|nr:zincin-like metallopeptidase domain-containing protein [Mucilaginibacter jinjuensis]WCT13745.1 zincin-like metallopeptidase domain-containing protein [Mucilaginibacter jinjuensis]
MPINEHGRAPAKALHTLVAEKLIAQLKNGTAPWLKPWRAGDPDSFQLPYNAVTGNRYKGINTLSLLTSDYTDPRWVTFKQAAAVGWQVKKGAQGTQIQFVKFKDFITKRDETGRPVLNEASEPVQMLAALPRPIITNAWVFNAAQISGIPPLLQVLPKSPEWDPHHRAESLIQQSGAQIEHTAGDRAVYNPVRDHITMPMRHQFDTADQYYATLLHELGHWTGHPTRLDRSLFNQYGTPGYAREELRAEIASLLIGRELHIGHDPGQHASYINSWISLLENSPFEIHAAAADAEKILNYLVGMERKMDLNLTQDQTGTLGPNPGKQKSTHFSNGEKILYNNVVYRVLSHLKRARYLLENENTGTSFVLSKSDGLYQSLVAAKSAPVHAIITPDKSSEILPARNSAVR